MHWLLQSLFLVLLSSIWPQDIDKLFIRFCKNRSMFIYLASWISKKNPSICYLCAISAYDYTVSEEFQCLDLVLVRSIIFKLRDLPLTHLIQRVFFLHIVKLEWNWTENLPPTRWPVHVCAHFLHQRLMVPLMGLWKTERLTLTTKSPFLKL